MDWIKPLLEKININGLFLAACLAAFIVWLNLKDTYLLLIWLCLAIYLFILLVCHLYSNYKANVRAERYKEIQQNDILYQDSAENRRVDIWFFAANTFIKDSLVQLLKLPSMPNAVNIKIQDLHNGLSVPSNVSHLDIPTDNPFKSIPLVTEIDNGLSDPAFFIHPHLYELIVQYASDSYSK